MKSIEKDGFDEWKLIYRLYIMLLQFKTVPIVRPNLDSYINRIRN